MCLQRPMRLVPRYEPHLAAIRGVAARRPRGLHSVYHCRRSGCGNFLRHSRAASGRRRGPYRIGRSDRKSTRLNSSHSQISYAVFCLKKKIAIARALVLKPRFIVLDEPTSALDMSVQAQIVDLLRDLQIRHKLAYLFISHDLRVMRALADEVVVLRHGKVVERGSAKQVFEAPQTPYTQALIAAAFNLEAIGADRNVVAIFFFFMFISKNISTFTSQRGITG